MTEFKPNPLFQHGVVTTNGDGLSIDQVSSLFKEHRDAVVAAQGEASNAKLEAQKAKDAAEAAARLAERARQDAETKAAHAATLESQVQVAEDALAESEGALTESVRGLAVVAGDEQDARDAVEADARSEAIANTEKILDAEYGLNLTGNGQVVEKPKRAPRARKVAEPTE